MSRLSRRQIKRDEVIETVGSVIDYSRDHRRGLLWGVVAVLALVAATVGFFVWRAQRAERTQLLLAEAVEASTEVGAAEADPSVRERFAEVVDRAGGSRAADVARLYLGSFAAADGDAERAQALWQETARRRAGTALGVQARLNLLELGREQGRHTELIAELREQLETGDENLGTDQLLYQLGLTLELAGQSGEARDVYQRLVDEHPLSALRGSASARAQRLEAEAG